jgi:hypothetical protein
MQIHLSSGSPRSGRGAADLDKIRAVNRRARRREESAPTLRDSKRIWAACGRSRLRTYAVLGLAEERLHERDPIP